MNEPDRPDRDERPTVVLLGASNLTRGISTVVKTLQMAHDSPVRIVAALGYGRSFGLRSRVLGRGLSPMLESGVWEAIDAQGRESGWTTDSPTPLPPPSREGGIVPPAFALITDIGNDVMYEAAPRQIIDWVWQCVDRLVAARVPHINITALPVGSIARVKPWQYAVVRAALFPTHHLTFEQAVQSALETQHRLERFVNQSPHASRIRLVPHEADWYGFDPIHIKRTRWPVAWARFLARHPHEANLRAPGSLRRWLRLRSHMPERYEVLGVTRSHPQPLRFVDGTTIEMY